MKCPKCGEDDINGPFCCGYEPKGKKKVMTPTPKKYVDEVESLSAILHEIYMKEAERQGDVRHDWDYSKLKESTKEYDRVLARYILEREATAHDEGAREEREACAKVAEETVCGCRIEKKCCSDIQASRSAQAIRQRSSK